MTYPESEIRKVLRLDRNITLDDVFNVDGLIVICPPGSEWPEGLAIDDEDLARACIDYLERMGAKKFGSWQEFEQWRSSQTGGKE